MREPRRPRARPGAAGRPAPRGWGGTASRRRGTAGGAEAVGAARGGGGGRPGWEEVTEAAEGAVLFREPSAFNELVVVREYAWGGATVRSLEFGLEDDLFQSAVAVPFRPTELLFAYTRAMLAAGLTFGDLAEGGGVTCVGGGAGSLPMALLQAFPELAVDVVEIDPVVAQAAATFLGLRARGGGPPEEAFLRGLRPRPNNSASAHDPPAAACRLWLRDAAAHLARAPPGSQAAVFVDAFDRDNEVPPQLAAPAFFADCLTALRPGGPLVWNTQFDFEAAPSLEEHCARELALAAVPAGSVGEVLAVPAGAGEAEPWANVVFVVRKAGGAPMAADALAARCDGLQRALGGDRLGIDVAHELGFDLARERCGMHRINERAWAGAA